MRLLLTFICLLFCMTLVVSCPSTNKNSSTSGGSSSAAAVVYPAGWPIPELTAPAGATADNLPPHSFNSTIAGDKPYTMESDQDRTVWAVAFDSSLGWDAVVAHVDGCVVPLGYNKYLVHEPKYNALSRGTHGSVGYNSPTTSYSIFLNYGKHPGNKISRAYDCYHLTVSK